MRSPRSTGWVASTLTVSSRAATVGTSMRPQCRYSALFVGPSSARVRTATIGRRCDTRRAMRAKRRGSPRSSVYMPITRVDSSSSKNCSRSVPETSARSPSDTNHDRPSACCFGQLEERGAERAGLHRDRHAALDQPLRQQRGVEADLRSGRRHTHARRTDDAHPVVAGPDDHRVDVDVRAVDRRHHDGAADVGGDAVVDRLRRATRRGRR